MDVTTAYRQATLRAIEYLRRLGYDDYQAYLLLSCAPVQGHVAGIVDIPNACATLGLPVDMFDFDVLPPSPSSSSRALGDVARDMGRCAFESGRARGEVLLPGARP